MRAEKYLLIGRPLSGRERQVLWLVARGWTYPKVAAELGVSAETVATHMQGIMAKLGAKNRNQAVALGCDMDALFDVIRTARPVLMMFPRCRLHPTVAPLPKQCPDCARWLTARQVVVDMDAALPGGAS